MPWQILGALLAIILTKMAIMMGLAELYRLPRQSAFEAAMLMGPGGEFAFVLLASATASGLFAPAATGPILLIVSLGMVALPLLARLAKTLRTKLKAANKLDIRVMQSPPAQDEAHVIVAGFGRVGSLVTTLLEEQNVPYLAVDTDINNVSPARNRGQKVYYGDATNAAFLEACGIDKAKCLAITMDNPAQVDEILKLARTRRPDLKIIARARDERHAMRLYQAGVTEAVPETIEASLQLGEAVLVETGVPMGLAIAAVHERRDGFRKLLGRPNRRDEVAKARSRLKGKK